MVKLDSSEGGGGGRRGGSLMHHWHHHHHHHHTHTIGPRQCNNITNAQYKNCICRWWWVHVHLRIKCYSDQVSCFSPSLCARFVYIYINIYIYINWCSVEPFIYILLFTRIGTVIDAVADTNVSVNWYIRPGQNHPDTRPTDNKHVLSLSLSLSRSSLFFLSYRRTEVENREFNATKWRWYLVGRRH